MAIENDTEAGPSRTPEPEEKEAAFQPGVTPYHETSQFRHWRYSRGRITALRAELNEKSKEVTARNMAAEKEAQQSLGHAFKDPPPPAAYLSVAEELMLVRFYCKQAADICRKGFGLPEAVESTAISYIKRFYLKNSVMEWHPKNILPTCVFLAAKTVNHPVPINVFVSKIKGVKENDVLDLEFLVAQSLSFEFWVRGADKALRGWGLELQDQPTPPVDAVQRALPAALDRLSASRLTDAEFLYTPSQISLACWHLANADLVDNYLDWKYQSAETAERAPGEPAVPPYGMERDALGRIIIEVADLVKEAGDGTFDVAKIKEVDKRLKSCANPERIAGTALYIKRKQEQEAKATEAKVAKSLKAQQVRAADDMVFGGSLGAPAKID